MLDELIPIPFSVEELPAEWQRKLTENQLTSEDIRTSWKYYVPEIFSPQLECDCLKIYYNEDLAQMYLFDPLERFMYGGDPIHISQVIKELDNPPSLCGKVFKNGDPTYGCRDCGLDPTCVLCAECFENSAHSKHRYKISTSSGGGYCDCGDSEAWKRDVFCGVHVKGKDMQPQQQNILGKLPSDLVTRIHFVFDTVLQYARQLLTHEENFSLPADLEIRDYDGNVSSPGKSLFSLKNSYVTMLYNDETHTYDQVISALMRAIECSKKDAVSYATSIDREGRCIVRCSTFETCSNAKELMDRPGSRSVNRPSLKVQVVHTFIIAHQVFASRLLTWLHNILESAQAFRLVFTAIVTKDSCSLIENIFRTDTQMWKTARIQWHRLFISGMLMEIESKKTFARVFTRHYDKMMKDFIHDDHEHSVCVVSLAVQLFTMPTIAHMLIGEEDVLARLLNTFLSECNKNLKNGKLYLESRSRNINTFKRIQYILYDMKYLLGFKPESWTSELRKGFLHGFEMLLKLLSMMQGMDPMVRQVWQHMEYEPEWEAAFNLHIKLSSIIPLVIDWAAADKVVLIKAFRMVLKSLIEQITEDMRRRYVIELLDYSVSCIEYDVSSAPVSLHLPLSRLVAGLYLQLTKYGLKYNSSEFLLKIKPTPEELLEPVLRTQVMIGQVNAGMWRRNGFSLTNQIYFYHNVRCRQEMLDRDIMLMQEIATLIEANEFIIHLLNRYKLINWTKSDFELDYIKGGDDDNHRQVVSLAEEFLLLLLRLVSERYTERIGAVSKEDCIKKEIVQLLCIEPMPHSVLDKSLPDDVNHETGMEKVIDEIAVFKKPSADGKGFFELKKQYHSDYNFFFYHYSKEDQSKSEVAQRNLKKSGGGDACCPPPIPPPFTENFMLLVNILQCDIFLHIAGLVLERMRDLKKTSANESHLLITLHMIGYALHEEERYIKNDDPYFRFTPKAKKYFILPRMELLVDCPRITTHKDILKWTIRRYHEVCRLSMSESMKTNAVPENVGPTVIAFSHVSAEKKRKSDIAAERKARIMNKMSSMQKNFILKNENLFEETSSSNDSEAISLDIPEVLKMETTYWSAEDMVAVGNNQTLTAFDENMYTCILCHQDDSVSPSASNDSTNSRAMVLGALVQRSTVLSRDRLNVAHLLNPDCHDTLLLPVDFHWGAHISSCGHAMHAKCWRRFFDDVLIKERRKPHRTRHLMSFDIEKNEYLCPLCERLCNTALPLLPTVTSKLRIMNKNAFKGSYLDLRRWKKAMEATIQAKSNSNDIKCSSGTEDVNESEKSSTKEENNLISETAAFKAISSLVSNEVTSLPYSLVQSKLGINQIVSNLKSRVKWKSSTENRSHHECFIEIPLDYLNEECPAAGKEFKELFICDGESSYPEFSSLALEMVNGFALTIYTQGLGVNPDLQNPRIPQMVWTSTAYTIRVLEETQRTSNRALLTSLSSRLQNSLIALVNFSSYITVCLDYKDKMNETAFRILCTLLDPSYEKDSMCLFDWDAFSMLVSLSLSLPSLYSHAQHVAKGSIQDHFVLQLTFYAHVVQILLQLNENDFVTDMELDISDCLLEDMPQHNTSFSMDTEPGDIECPDGEFLLSLANMARYLLNIPPISIKPQRLFEHVTHQCLPFLRCSGLFFHFLTEVQVPEELKSTVWVPESEFFCLLRYLGLGAHFRDVFNHEEFRDILKVWCLHPRLPLVLEEWRKRFSHSNIWSHINRLVSLPKDYSELINTVSQFPCPASIGDDSRTPTMCLICGKMLCSQSYCCQMELPDGSENMVGACTFHANFCGAGVGLFLRVRECRILLLAGRIKGCFMPPPYLDAYGEADQLLKRGNPLRLDESSYTKLHNMWLSHAVPDVIAHTMENSSVPLVVDWFHF